MKYDAERVDDSNEFLNRLNLTNGDLNCSHLGSPTKSEDFSIKISIK